MSGAGQNWGTKNKKLFVQAQFQDAGADYGAILVNYCWVGMRASYTYLIAKHLGYDARLYAGSWNQWSKNDSLPAVIGSFPD